MRQHFFKVRDFILPIIDFFYPPFKRIVPLQTFRYLVCGAANTLLGLVLFYTSYHYLFKRDKVDLGFYAFESYTASLAISFTATFLLGFFLMKYVVFDDSQIRGHVQLFRYLLVCLVNLTLNYVLLKLSVEVLGIYPTLAQLATTGIIIILSYLGQRYFSFKKKVLPEYLDEDDKQLKK